MGDEPQPNYEVFISYSSKDKKWADAACAVLERHRIRCWVAPRDITPGSEWGASIMNGLNGSQIMVLIFSGHANASPQVRREVERAGSRGMSILAVRVEDVLPDGAMEFALGNRHWLDAFTPPVERRMELLARSVKTLLGADSREASERTAPPVIAPAPPRPYGRFLIAAGFAVPMVIIVAGLFAMFRGRAAQPIAEAATRTAQAVSKPAPSTTRVESPKPAPPSEKPPPPSPQPTPGWTSSIGIKLVRIEAGDFLMGTTKDQVDQLIRLFPAAKRELFDHEQPAHSVRLRKAFYLGIYEVTQGQYQAVMGGNPSHFKGSDDLPVETVSWLDAVTFCNRLSEREKRRPFYRIDGTEVTLAGGNSYRLPTEAEWEYACRAGSTTRYPFGDDWGKLGEHAWSQGNSESKTHPVGQKLPNAWGLYDMLGNVWEWCADGYEAAYYASSPPADPPGAPGASRRVIRGGGWSIVPGYCRPASRVGRMPKGKNNDLGFRVAAVQE